MLAAEFNDVETLQLLIKHGAVHSLRDAAGNTAKYIAEQLKSQEADVYLQSLN